MSLIGKLICWRKGHKRRKLVPGTELLKCPRCGNVKVKQQRKKHPEQANATL